MSVEQVCNLVGLTKQAYYKRKSTANLKGIRMALVLELVSSIRAKHPRIGTRKLHVMLSLALLEQGYYIGKDALFKLLSDHGLLIRQRRSRVPKTTISDRWRRQFDDLVTGKPHDILPLTIVSDITYVMVQERWIYLALLTELHSRYIVGYQVAERMTVEELCLPALKMALANIPQKCWQGAIHHSDRGSQYLSEEYTRLLKDCNFQLSTTQNGSPYENAVAERINGIIKNEYLPEQITDFFDAKKYIKRSIKLYNKERPHESLNMATPEIIWKNYLSDLL